MHMCAHMYVHMCVHRCMFMYVCECMHVCLCMHMSAYPYAPLCVHGCMFMCMCVCDSEGNLGCHSSGAVTLFIEIRSLIGLKSNEQAGWRASEPRRLPVPISPALGSQAWTTISGFYVDSAD